MDGEFEFFARLFIKVKNEKSYRILQILRNYGRHSFQQIECYLTLLQIRFRRGSFNKRLVRNWHK